MHLRALGGNAPPLSTAGAAKKSKKNAAKTEDEDYDEDDEDDSGEEDDSEGEEEDSDEEDEVRHPTLHTSHLIEITAQQRVVCSPRYLSTSPRPDKPLPKLASNSPPSQPPVLCHVRGRVPSLGFVRIGGE